MKLLEAGMMQKQADVITSEDERGAVTAGGDGAMKEMQGDVQAGLIAAAGVGKHLQSNASTRRLSAESQDFEFNKVGDMVSPYNVRSDHNQAGVLASADELFYKGQLLPLQYNNPSWSHHHLRSISTNSTIAATASISSPSHELPFEPLSSQLISKEQDVRVSSSCRMDNLNLGLDSSLFDFRCSSFRSHSSKYRSYYCNYYANYGSNCTSNSSMESSTASSSSRDSNGSSQDSACSSSYPDHNHMREHHLCCACSCHSHIAHLPKEPHQCPKRKQGFIQSWRLLIHGLKRGASHDHQVHHRSSNFCNIQGDLKASSAELNHIHTSSLAANQGYILLTCGCKAQICRRGYKIYDEKPRSSTTGLKAGEKEGIRTHLSADNQPGPVSEVKKASKAPSTIINGASNHSAVSTKWQGYTKRIKPISMIKARLVGSKHHAGQEVSKGGTQSAARVTEEERACSKKRITRKLSLEREFSQPSLCDSSVKGLSNLQVSFQFHAVSSSCPASVRTSPNHSGLLSAPSTTMSTMQELHSAVQGAIAHCKQSNSAHIVAHTPSS